MMRELWLKLRKKLALLILLAVFLFSLFPITAFAATERYQILKIGDKDEYVLALQTKLKDLGYFDGTTTGYFGTKTQQSVIDYQTANSLLVDGKAGPETLSAIMGEDFEMMPDKRQFTAGDTGSDYPEPGDKGTSVADIQKRLKELEYYDYPSITGYYGPVTEEAVKRFQSTNGLTVDGVAGPETMTLLNTEDAKFYCIYPGDRGEDVAQLQVRLTELGYFSGTATGYFGGLTTDALKEFQAQSGLAIDAKAGKNTRANLYSDIAPAWDGTDRIQNEDAPAQTESTTEKMLAFANEQLEKPYIYSTEGPNSFDCSGFVYYVLKYMGVSTKRCSADGFSKIESWTKISDIGALLPGDILFFQADSGSRINHTGIYLSDDLFIHASSSHECVIISSLSDYYERNFTFARRIY